MRANCVKIVKEVKMVEKRVPPLMRGGPSCTGGRVQLPHSNKLTSPLAHMFIAVVTAMHKAICRDH